MWESVCILRLDDYFLDMETLNLLVSKMNKTKGGWRCFLFPLIIQCHSSSCFLIMSELGIFPFYSFGVSSRFIAIYLRYFLKAREYDNLKHLLHTSKHYPPTPSFPPPDVSHTHFYIIYTQSRTCGMHHLIWLEYTHNGRLKSKWCSQSH